MAVAWNDTVYDVPLYVTEYNDGITIFIDYNDTDGDFYPTLRISTADDKIYDFNLTKVEDTYGAYKSYYFCTFEANTAWFGLPFTSLFDFKASLLANSTCYYMSDIEADWNTAVNIFSVDFPEPEGPSDFVPNEWYEIVLVWVYDLFDPLVELFKGIFSIFDVDFSAIGDFFSSLLSDNGIFAWLHDTAFYSQLVLFFSFLASTLSVLPTEIRYIITFAIGASIGFAILKIVSR